MAERKIMLVKGTYFQNDRERPLVYGEVEIMNPRRKRLRGEEEKEGVLAEPVIVGFCGTDNELMRMGREGLLSKKFPKDTSRLINGHEGIVWVPSQNRFAIVLIRGGNSYDPTRYTEEETYFEYGCDQADGLFCDQNYFHPDMLLPIPEGYVRNGKLALSFAKKMVFPDPYGCMVFQLERMEDLGSAQNFRVEMAKRKCGEEEARQVAKDSIFNRTVIFGLGTTGMFMGDLIRQNHPNAQIIFVGRGDRTSAKVEFALEQTGGMYVQNNYDTYEELAKAITKVAGGRATTFIGASGSEVEHRLAFEYKVLGCNGIYNSFSLGPKLTFDTMPFGFENHLIFGSINFRQDHMEKAIHMLELSRYGDIVTLIEKEEFIADPIKAYQEKIYSKKSPMKTAVIWNDRYIDMDR
ncbi:MAG: Glucose dehydrogenase C-terminus [Anaerocolumna sp.]|nr:Glucose dehydrogenase C-terminus [Anaerocolumna sp.]